MPSIAFSDANKISITAARNLRTGHYALLLVELASGGPRPARSRAGQGISHGDYGV
jgi:hypothetical protein